MAEPDPGYEFLQTTLENHPDVAQAVGRYFATFAILEHELYIVFAKVLNTDLLGAFALLAHIQSFTIKLEAVQTYLRHSRLSEDTKTHCKHIMDIAFACNSFRNKIAHGQFGITPKGQLMLVPYSTSGDRKSKEEDIDAKKINRHRTEDLDRARFLITLLIKGEPIPHGLKLEPSIVPK